MLTYSAYEKGILPEPGGLGSQPLKFLPMMALVSSRTNTEVNNERDRQQDKGNKGKQSLTEQYLEQAEGHDDPITMADPKQEEAKPQIFSRKNPVIKGVSPDGHAAVPGLLKPRTGIGRSR